MESHCHYFTSSAPNSFASILSPRLALRESPRRDGQGQRHSSISRNAKLTEGHQVASSKSIGLSFTKQNRSKRSIRLRQSKQNREGAVEIGSEKRMVFKGVPPKRKRNPSKFCEGEVGGVLQDQENRSDPSFPLNGYLKTASSLCIDNFQVLRKLGEGSFSQVFLVVERTTGALLALKVMEKAGLQELGVVDRLASELKIQQFCTHLNIVKLYGVFHDATRIYLIQEFAGSRSLFSRMEQGRLTGREVQSIVRQLCNAVRFLHVNSIIHRDIKPENVLIGPGGVVKLTDFGWSVYSPHNALRDTLCGTPLYLSPEIISAEKYDRSVDLWAIGVLTFELLTGEMPFGIKSLQDLRKIVTEDIDLSGIADPAARSFVSTLLVKDSHLRKGIVEICEHEFLRQEGSSRCE